MSQTSKMLAAVLAAALIGSTALVGCGRRNNTPNPPVNNSSNSQITAPGNNGTGSGVTGGGGLNGNGTDNSLNSHDTGSGTNGVNGNGGSGVNGNGVGTGNGTGVMGALGNTIDNVYNDVMNGAEDWLDTIDENTMKTAYGMDFSNFDEYYGRIPRKNTHATSVIGVKVKNGKKAEARAELMKYQAALEKNFETYLPGEYDMVKDYRIIENGDYMVLVIAENADAVETAFGKAFDRMK